MVLTKDQSTALSEILKFIDAPVKQEQDRFMTLIGYAGTGKTTVVNNIIQSIGKRKKIVVSAPTHKAKEVIAKVTNNNSETIQAILGLKPNTDLENFNPNKPIFEALGREKIKLYELIIIDEASMLGKMLVNMIKEKAALHKVKVLFVGDQYQLPPVGEILSTVFTLPNKVELTEIVRQKDSNPNTKLIELARNDVRDGTDFMIPYLKTVVRDVNENNEGFTKYSKEDYYPAMLEKYFDSEYAQNPNLTKMICWTNKTVQQTNLYIRSQLIKSKELVAVGDILMGYKSVSYDILTPPFYISVVRNSFDYIVEKVVETTKEVQGTTFKIYRTTVKESQANMDILHRDSYQDFIDHIKELHEKAVATRKWFPFFQFKQELVLIEGIRFGPAPNQVCDHDISYGYALTTHKSQGSTYTNVGINLKELMLNRTDKERRQLIYVALSRTEKENKIYG
jgi:hypothetical protein